MEIYMNPYSPAYGLALGKKFLRFGTVGVDYTPSPDAPSTYPELMQEWQRACTRKDGEARHLFRVYDGGCEGSIYGGPAENHAQRYLHDLVHCTLKLEFDIVSEIQATQAQMAMLGCISAEEARTFLIDVGGQALYHTMTGEFVKDQSGFCEQVYEDMRMIRETYGDEGENEIQLLTRAVRLYVNAFCYPNATRNS